MSQQRLGLHALTAICAGAALIGVTACGPNNADTTSAVDPDTGAPGASDVTTRTGSPITVTGCLQQEDHDYILTAMNEPGMAGAPAAAGNKVGTEQLTEARHAYKLSSRDDLDVLVGKSVRVEGTLARRSDVVRTGNQPTTDRQDLDQGDLAAIDVTTINQVADACGQTNGDSPHNGPSSRN